jgi:hypothetical protein
MNVTRDVIYDLLPAYFSGDASADTQALIEEFFVSDPEFGRMARRFHSLNASRPAGEPLEADRAKVVFSRARASMKLKLSAVAFGLGGLFAFGMAAFVGEFSLRHPGLIIGTVFSGMAVATWLMSYSSRPEWWYATFSGD